MMEYKRSSLTVFFCIDNWVHHSLNLSFSEIRDPKGICKDLTGLGRWGNGDVEVSVSSIAEIPYIVGLVRQAYEKQIGSGADT